MNIGINELVKIAFDMGITIYPVPLPSISRYKKNNKWHSVYHNIDRYTIEINIKGKVHRDKKQDYKKDELQKKIKKYYKFFVDKKK